MHFRSYWEIAPPMVPIKREIILSFLSGAGDVVPQHIIELINELKNKEKYKIEQACHVTETSDLTSTDWKLCETFQFRFEQLSRSTFSLVPIVSTVSSALPRLVESMMSGSVPVIISYSGKVTLPMNEVIDWSKVVMQIPFGRIPELPFFLSTITPDHIFTLRKQGFL